MFEISAISLHVRNLCYIAPRNRTEITTSLHLRFSSRARTRQTFASVNARLRHVVVKLNSAGREYLTTKIQGSCWPPVSLVHFLHKCPTAVRGWVYIYCKKKLVFDHTPLTMRLLMSLALGALASLISSAAGLLLAPAVSFFRLIPSSIGFAAGAL